MREPVARGMGQVGKFLRLPASDRRLLLTAALLQAALRLGLTLLAYRKLRTLVDRLARLGPRRRLVPAASPERIAWAVTRASHTIPGATCLSQALATKVLLERAGHPAQVHIGVSRTGGAGLLGHAWVECEGRIVLGETDLARYTSLGGLEGGSR